MVTVLVSLLTLVVGAYLGHFFTKRRISDANQKEASAEVSRLLRATWLWQTHWPGEYADGLSSHDIEDVEARRIDDAIRKLRERSLRDHLKAFLSDLENLGWLPSRTPESGVEPMPEERGEWFAEKDSLKEVYAALQDRLAKYHH